LVTTWRKSRPDCLQLQSGLDQGKWTDEICSLPASFICEGDLCPNDPADAGVRFDVADEPLRVEHEARMTFRSVGATDGLLIWSWRGDLRGDCKSTLPDSSSSCSTFVDIERGRSFQLGLLGFQQGDYDLEGALYDYTGPESLFQEPVCRVHSTIKVVRAR
jgi:hypothetical protein